MRGPELQKWETTLRGALGAVDRQLEERYGSRYVLRPNRPPAGQTASFTADGLFSVSAKYTTGIGSPTGEGYIVEIRAATFETVPAEVREDILGMAATHLAKELDRAFPEQELDVTREGRVLKIRGDLALT